MQREVKGFVKELLMAFCVMCPSPEDCMKTPKFLYTTFLRYKKMFLFHVGMKQKAFTVNK